MSGCIFAIGIGPGGPGGITLDAREALLGSQVIVGYGPYLEMVADLIAGKEQVTTGMRHEVERCRAALEARGLRAQGIGVGMPGWLVPSEKPVFSSVAGALSAATGLPVEADDGDPAVEAVLRRDLEQRLGALGGPGATEIRATPRLGWVAETLALVAGREHFDLLLVGGRPRGGLSRIRQDSVSEGLLRLAPTSVLRVPLAAGAEEHAPPPPRLATLLAPSDLSPLSNEGVRYAYALAPDGGTVVLLHVIEVPPLPSPLYAHYGRRLPPEARAERARAAEAALRALVPADAEARGIETRVEIVEGEPGEAIRAAAERWGADAVCLASHGRSGLSRLLGGSEERRVGKECRSRWSPYH